LTRAEFERRYRAMPGVKKAELIEGIVYMPSPVRMFHAVPHARLCTWLGYYVAKTSGLEDRLADNATARIDEDNEPQPDLMLLLPKPAGGMAEADQDGYVTGPPTLACEIAASTVSIDLHAKLEVYRRTGVREYLVWRTEDATIDWFILREGQYVQFPHDDRGVLKSEQFPGLWLDVPALLKGDLAALFRVVDEGVGTAEHAEFVKRLRG
jgi:Uma2 family endonuclease